MEDLIAKYLTNNATVSEIEKLEEWIKLKGNEELFEEYVKINFTANHQAALPNILKNKRMLLENARKKKIFFPIHAVKKTYKYAAIFVGLVVLTTYFYKESQTRQEQEKSLVQPKLIIANEHVVLKNENGETQVLGEELNTIIIHDAKGKQVAQQQGTQIKYDMDTNTTEELVYNEMVVPYGRRFQVTLSDGTQVHLNSGTSFRFPVKFIAGKERQVFLKGEAFFDVVKNKKDAFVINSKDVDIKVLGTKFNVSSYEEDEEINTVLVTGSVQIYDSSKPSTTIVIEPGQMASWNKEQKNISIEDVDIDLHTAWMEGRLILRKTSFKVIRRKLERYYNISIVNHNELLDGLYYNINFDNETIEQVLKTLNENFDIDYKINGNTIIIN